jgi:hypothetical protein
MHRNLNFEHKRVKLKVGMGVKANKKKILITP